MKNAKMLKDNTQFWIYILSDNDS